MSDHLRRLNSSKRKKPAKASKQKQTSLISPRDAEGVANLLTNATKCSGKMGNLFNLDGFEATRLQPSRIARRKADLQGFETPQAL